jgi:hypothetical protein
MNGFFLASYCCPTHFPALMRRSASREKSILRALSKLNLISLATAPLLSSTALIHKLIHSFGASKSLSRTDKIADFMAVERAKIRLSLIERFVEKMHA